MNLVLSSTEADFLAAQLQRHIESVEIELAHTEKHQLQHALAADLEGLRTILERLTRAPRT
jgi:hypothetical protein